VTISGSTDLPNPSNKALSTAAQAWILQIN